MTQEEFQRFVRSRVDRVHYGSLDRTEVDNLISDIVEVHGEDVDHAFTRGVEEGRAAQ
jgi:hypothetical protein